MFTNLSGWTVYNWFIREGFGSGTKNSAAVRSGIPISHRVGPFLGGSYTRFPSLILHPSTKKSSLRDIDMGDFMIKTFGEVVVCTWCDVNLDVTFVIADESWNPSIEVVVPRPNVVDYEVSFSIRLSPELIALCPNRNILGNIEDCETLKKCGSKH